MIFNIKPNWNITDFKKLEYTLCTHKDEKVLNDYLNSGHDPKWLSIYNYHEPNPMPDVVFNYIKPYFNHLDNVCMAINYFKPGQYLPLHVDVFGRYIQVQKVDPNKIIRYMVMLEDNYPGQILQIKDSCISSWKAGDCFSWKYDDLHAFYNFSMNDRYAIQVTGVTK
jgi:hypothetical protein